MRNVTPEQVAMAEQPRGCQTPPHRVARRSSWDGRHMASIRTAGLAKNFGDLRAVNEIDLDLPEGGVAGFVGPNGAGKSTTIRMLLGLITPTGGEGEVFGHPIGRPAAYDVSNALVS